LLLFSLNLKCMGSEMSRKLLLCFFIPIIVFGAYVDCYSLNHHQLNSEKVSLV
jgi:hypothetical protein